MPIAGAEGPVSGGTGGIATLPSGPGSSSYGGAGSAYNPQLNSLLQQLYSQFGPQVQAFNLAQGTAGQGLATNAAQYGPQGYLAQNLQTNTGLQQQQLGISELANTQAQTAFNQAQNANNPNSIESQQWALQQGQFGTQVQDLLGNAAASGATGASSTRTQLGTLQAGQQSQVLGQQAAKIQSTLQSQGFQNTAKSNNISAQQLANQLAQGMQQLNITGEQNQQQILEAAAQGYENLPPALAQILSQVAAAGGVSNIFQPKGGALWTAPTK